MKQNKTSTKVIRHIVRVQGHQTLEKEIIIFHNEGGNLTIAFGKNVFPDSR